MLLHDLKILSIISSTMYLQNELLTRQYTIVYVRQLQKTNLLSGCLYKVSARDEQAWYGWKWHDMVDYGVTHFTGKGAVDVT